MDSFIYAATGFAAVMMIWDCIEVGRNDAANLVNAVFGARVMQRRTAVWVAGAAVILGAGCGAAVIETARKDIFDPSMLSMEGALSVYLTAYVVDTVLLYTFSAFGMPVSTTATLLFTLVGASLGVSLSSDIVKWSKVGTVVTAIFMSIVMSGIAGFLIQRVFRGAVRDDCQDRNVVLLHGPWTAGLMLTWLMWFMLMKGLKSVEVVKAIKENTIAEYGVVPVLLILWAVWTLVIHVVLAAASNKGTKYLYHVTAVIGMICMAFAFGQNDLANCASPGLSSLELFRNQELGVLGATKIEINRGWLFLCGGLMALGMFSQNAQRVTRAAVNTGSQYDQVALYAPGWCKQVAKRLLRITGKGPDIAPPSAMTEAGKRIHYDPLRASVIMAVSSSVIAYASGRGLPVSTTYVAFAAVVATGWGDRIFDRGDADLKLGRAFWVVSGWFFGALLAMTAGGIVAYVIFNLGIAGILLMLAVNLATRHYMKKRSDRHEVRYHTDVSERDPE